MLMQGDRVIRADRHTVWAALNDPGVLRACIPGCDSLVKTSDTSFEATVTQKIGPVKASFAGAVQLSDIVEAESYTISGEGKGGAAGFAKGGAKVRLEDAPEGTHLHYEAEAKVGGKLAQLGARLIDGVAKKLADEFFTRFQQTVESPAPANAPAVAADGEAPETDGTDQPKKKGWLGRVFG